MDSLPEEVLLEVLNRVSLASAPALKSATIVCQQWRAVAASVTWGAPLVRLCGLSRCGDLAGVKAAVLRLDLAKRAAASSVREAFVAACEGGHVPVAQWLAAQLRLQPKEGRAARQKVFRNSSAPGRSKVVQWLQKEFSLPPVQHARYDRKVLAANGA